MIQYLVKDSYVSMAVAYLTRESSRCTMRIRSVSMLIAGVVRDVSSAVWAEVEDVVGERAVAR